MSNSKLLFYCLFGTLVNKSSGVPDNAFVKAMYCNNYIQHPSVDKNYTFASFEQDNITASGLQTVLGLDSNFDLFDSISDVALDFAALEDKYAVLSNQSVMELPISLDLSDFHDIFLEQYNSVLALQADYQERTNQSLELSQKYIDSLIFMLDVLSNEELASRVTLNLSDIYVLGFKEETKIQELVDQIDTPTYIYDDSSTIDLAALFLLSQTPITAHSTANDVVPAPVAAPVTAMANVKPAKAVPVLAPVPALAPVIRNNINVAPIVAPIQPREEENILPAQAEEDYETLFGALFDAPELSGEQLAEARRLEAEKKEAILSAEQVRADVVSEQDSARAELKLRMAEGVERVLAEEQVRSELAARASAEAKEVQARADVVSEQDSARAELKLRMDEGVEHVLAEEQVRSELAARASAEEQEAQSRADVVSEQDSARAELKLRMAEGVEHVLAEEQVRFELAARASAEEQEAQFRDALITNRVENIEGFFYKGKELAQKAFMKGEKKARFNVESEVKRFADHAEVEVEEFAARLKFTESRLLEMSQYHRGYQRDTRNNKMLDECSIYNRLCEDLLSEHLQALQSEHAKVQAEERAELEREAQNIAATQLDEALEYELILGRHQQIKQNVKDRASAEAEEAQVRSEWMADYEKSVAQVTANSQRAIKERSFERQVFMNEEKKECIAVVDEEDNAFKDMIQQHSFAVELIRLQAIEREQIRRGKEIDARNNMQFDEELIRNRLCEDLLSEHLQALQSEHAKVQAEERAELEREAQNIAATQLDEALEYELILGRHQQIKQNVKDRASAEAEEAQVRADVVSEQDSARAELQNVIEEDAFLAKMESYIRQELQEQKKLRLQLAELSARASAEAEEKQVRAELQFAVRARLSDAKFIESIYEEVDRHFTSENIKSVCNNAYSAACKIGGALGKKLPETDLQYCEQVKAKVTKMHEDNTSVLCRANDELNKKFGTFNQEQLNILKKLVEVVYKQYGNAVYEHNPMDYAGYQKLLCAPNKFFYHMHADGYALKENGVLQALNVLVNRILIYLPKTFPDQRSEQEIYNLCKDLLKSYIDSIKQEEILDKTKAFYQKVMAQLNLQILVLEEESARKQMLLEQEDERKQLKQVYKTTQLDARVSELPGIEEEVVDKMKKEESEDWQTMTNLAEEEVFITQMDSYLRQEQQELQEQQVLQALQALEALESEISERKTSLAFDTYLEAAKKDKHEAWNKQVEEFGALEDSEMNARSKVCSFGDIVVKPCDSVYDGDNDSQTVYGQFSPKAETAGFRYLNGSVRGEQDTFGLPFSPRAGSENVPVLDAVNQDTNSTSNQDKNDESILSSDNLRQNSGDAGDRTQEWVHMGLHTAEVEPVSPVNKAVSVASQAADEASTGLHTAEVEPVSPVNKAVSVASQAAEQQVDKNRSYSVATEAAHAGRPSDAPTEVMEAERGNSLSEKHSDRSSSQNSRDGSDEQERSLDALEIAKNQAGVEQDDFVHMLNLNMPSAIPSTHVFSFNSSYENSMNQDRNASGAQSSTNESVALEEVFSAIKSNPELDDRVQTPVELKNDHASLRRLLEVSSQEQHEYLQLLGDQIASVSSVQEDDNNEQCAIMFEEKMPDLFGVSNAFIHDVRKDEADSNSVTANESQFADLAGAASVTGKPPLTPRVAAVSDTTAQPIVPPLDFSKLDGANFDTKSKNNIGSLSVDTDLDFSHQSSNPSTPSMRNRGFKSPHASALGAISECDISATASVMEITTACTPTKQFVEEKTLSELLELINEDQSKVLLSALQDCHPESGHMKNLRDLFSAGDDIGKENSKSARETDDCVKQDNGKVKRVSSEGEQTSKTSRLQLTGASSPFKRTSVDDIKPLSPQESRSQPTAVVSPFKRTGGHDVTNQEEIAQELHSSYKALWEKWIVLLSNPKECKNAIDSLDSDKKNILHRVIKQYTSQAYQALQDQPINTARKNKAESVTEVSNTVSSQPKDSSQGISDRRVKARLRSKQAAFNKCWDELMQSYNSASSTLQRDYKEGIKALETEKAKLDRLMLRQKLAIEKELKPLKDVGRVERKEIKEEEKKERNELLVEMTNERANIRAESLKREEEREKESKALKDVEKQQARKRKLIDIEFDKIYSSLLIQELTERQKLETALHNAIFREEVVNEHNNKQRQKRKGATPTQSKSNSNKTNVRSASGTPAGTPRDQLIIAQAKENEELARRKALREQETEKARTVYLEEKMQSVRKKEEESRTQIIEAGENAVKYLSNLWRAPKEFIENLEAERQKRIFDEQVVRKVLQAHEDEEYRMMVNRIHRFNRSWAYLKCSGATSDQLALLYGVLNKPLTNEEAQNMDDYVHGIRARLAAKRTNAATEVNQVAAQTSNRSVSAVIATRSERPSSPRSKSAPMGGSQLNKGASGKRAGAVGVGSTAAGKVLYENEQRTGAHDLGAISKLVSEQPNVNQQARTDSGVKKAVASDRDQKPHAKPSRQKRNGSIMFITQSPNVSVISHASGCTDDSLCQDAHLFDSRKPSRSPLPNRSNAQNASKSPEPRKPSVSPLPRGAIGYKALSGFIKQPQTAKKKRYQ